MKNSLKLATLPALLVVTLGSAAVLAQSNSQSASSMPVSTQGRALERFQAADTNKDGALTKEEATRGMPRMAERFAALDTNQDGKVTAEEFQTLRNNARGAGRPDGVSAQGAGRVAQAGMGQSSMRQTAMRGGTQASKCLAMAADTDGAISRAAVEKLARPNALNRFDTLDADKDGVLSKGEQAACAMAAN